MAYYIREYSNEMNQLQLHTTGVNLAHITLRERSEIQEYILYNFTYI